MAQVTQITINNQAFSTFRTTMNDSLSAINSMHSGTSRPGSATTGTLWLDTTNAGSNSLTIKFFDGSDDITFATIDTSANTVNFIDSVVTGFDIVTDTTPQIGGDLASNGHDILFADNDKAKFGTGNDLQIFHDGSNSYVKDDGTGFLVAQTNGNGILFQNENGNETLAKFLKDGAVELYHDNSKKFETTSTGATVTGNLTATGNISAGNNGSLFLLDNVGTKVGQITNDSSSSHSLQIDADPDNSGADTYMQFKIDDSEKVRITSAGNFLVAKTSTTRTVAGAEIRTNGFIRGTRDQGNPLELVRTTDDGDAIKIYKDNTNVGVLGTQKWGIGTASPTAKLQVTSANSGGTPHASADELAIENSANAGINILSGASNEGAIYFGDSSDNDIGRVRYNHSTNAMDFTVNASVRTTIDSSGNFFVATTTEASDDVGHALLANGAAYHTANGTYAGLFNRKSSDGDLVQFRKDNTVKHVITTTRMGIGNGNPQNKLDISALTWDDGILIKNTGNFNVGIIADANRSSGGGGLLNLQGRWNGTEVTSILLQAGSDTTNKDDGEIVFRTAPAGTPQERVKITSAGFVGIGTSSPATSLHISSNAPQISLTETDQSNKQYRIGSFGAAYAVYDVSASQYRHIIDTNGNHIFNEPGLDCDFRVESNNNANMLFIDGGNDKVGIGTSSPSQPLDVLGSAQISFSSGVNTYQYFQSTSNFIGRKTDGNLNIGVAGSQSIVSSVGGSEKMRIDSSGSVGIGTSSIDAKLHISSSNTNISPNPNANQLYLEKNGNCGLTIATNTGGIGTIFFADSGDHARGRIRYHQGTDKMEFGTAGGADKLVIDSSGSVLIKKTTSGFNTAGFEVKAGDEPIFVTTENNYNLLVNRRSSDGDLIRFYRSTSEKGSISVSGETVSYNGFTGSHWSRFADNSKPTILRGTVLETLDEMLDWYNLEYNITTTTKDEDGNDVTNTETFGVPHVLTDSQSAGDTITYNHEGTDVQATIVKEADVKHMMSKVSDTTDAKNVYGVFNCYDEEQSEEGYNDFLVASVGSFLVRIKDNETIAKGDLLQSNGDGTAKVQIDDNVKSSSFAKVLSITIIKTYEDGSYLVPCSLNC